MVICSWHLKIYQITIKAPRVKLQHAIATSPQQKKTYRYSQGCRGEDPFKGMIPWQNQQLHKILYISCYVYSSQKEGTFVSICTSFSVFKQWIQK